MAQGMNFGTYRRLTASGSLAQSTGNVLGFFVASNTAGTIQLNDSPSDASGALMLNTFTVPAVGWYPCPLAFALGLFVTIGGTIDVTFCVVA